MSELSDDVNMFEQDYVDSLGIFQLLLGIEKDFGITLLPEDIIGDNIATINGLSKIISSKDSLK